jgi:hypothetical protein
MSLTNSPEGKTVPLITPDSGETPSDSPTTNSKYYIEDTMSIFLVSLG